MHNRTLFLKIYALFFGGIGAPVALLTGGFTVSLVWAAAACLILATLVFVVVSSFASTMVNILLGLGGKIGKREQLTSDLLKAKHYMAHGKLIRAKEVISGVLQVDPNFGDALLVQAQVIHRSSNWKHACIILNNIIKVCHKDDVSRWWALNYLREMNEKNVK